MVLNRDGWPSAKQPRLQDTGVAVYFKLSGEDRCIPSDKYVRAEDNLWAVGKSVEALRSLDRWGTGQIMKAAFSGFASLPENATAIGDTRLWYEILEVSQDTSMEVIKAAYKSLLQRYHPDKGGSQRDFESLQRAYIEAKMLKEKS